MNYIQQINLFWEKADDSPHLKGNYIAIYFALLRINNKYGWKEWFGADWAEVCQYSKVSKNTFYTGIEVLQDEGFILFEKGERSHLKPRFSVLIFENRTGTEQEQKGNKKGTKQEQKGNLDKLINYKTNKLTKEEAFIIFWEQYHNDTGKKKTDKEPAHKYFMKLSAKEIEKALESTELYAKTNEVKYLKKAYTYLRDKNFNDDLSASESSTKEKPKYLYKIDGRKHEHSDDNRFNMHKRSFPNHIEIIRQ